MAIREELVASAVSFLQDPSVASSSVESKVSFLKAKNLTQEEIDASFARVGSPAAGAAVASSQAVVHPAQQPYYGQYQQPPFGWQAPPPAPPKRDWRDWFIMATVLGGVGYGLYFVSKRYIAPLVVPPTPEKLDQDKTTVDEQFDKAFAAIDQLAKDTEVLKNSEKERSEKIDKIVSELEAFMRDTKSAGRRQDDETDRLRDEMKSLKGVIPGSMNAHKEFTDGRLREIAAEVKSLKSLIGQRLGQSSTPAPVPAPASLPPSSQSSNYLKPTSGNAAPLSPTTTPNGVNYSASGNENAAPSEPAQAEAATASTTTQDSSSPFAGRLSSFGTGAGGKPAIPAWQMAMHNKSAESAKPATSPQPEAAASSSS